MQLSIPQDLEALIEKRLASGAYTSVEDVFRRALEAQDAEESWTEEERSALFGSYRRGLPAGRAGELIDGDRAREEIQSTKEHWPRQRLLHK